MPHPANDNPEIQHHSGQNSRDDSRHRDDSKTAIEVAYSTNEERSNAALLRAAARAIDAHPEQGYEEFESDYERLQGKYLLQLTGDFNAGNLTTDEFKNLIRALYSGDSSDLDQLPFYDLRVAKLVLQNHPSPSSNNDTARDLSSLSYRIDRDADAKEDKLRQSLIDSQDQTASELGSKTNRPERLKDIDITPFVSAVQQIINDESLPNRKAFTTQPRQEETVTEVMTRGNGIYIQVSETKMPAGEREVNPDREVKLYHMITEFSGLGVRVEIHVHDNTLASAAYVDYSRQDHTDRKTSRQTYDRVMEVFELAIDELKSTGTRS